MADPIKETVADMPKANEAAVAADREREAAKRRGEGLTDLAGNSFDPTLHEVNADGTPRISAHGKLLRKRGMGARGARRPGTAAPGRGMGPEDQRAATAMGMVKSIEMIGFSIGGDEWAMSEPESLYMSSAFARFMEARNLKDIPPGTACLLAMCMYIAPRLSKPKTKTALARAKSWVISSYFRLRHGGNARPDNRNDGQRENDGSKKTGERIQA